MRQGIEQFVDAKARKDVSVADNPWIDPFRKRLGKLKCAGDGLQLRGAVTDHKHVSGFEPLALRIPGVNAVHQRCLVERQIACIKLGCRAVQHLQFAVFVPSAEIFNFAAAKLA